MDARGENLRFGQRPRRRCEPGKRFPQFLISISICFKMRGTKRHTVPESNTSFIYEYATNPCRNFSNLTKHSYGVLRLYECSRNARLLLVSQRSSRKTPRWQPRGRDTHSFRPLVQEEKVSFGAIYSSPCPRVNLCLASSRKSAADSILDGKGDTHEIQLNSSEHRIARGGRAGRAGFR